MTEKISTSHEVKPDEKGDRYIVDGGEDGARYERKGQTLDRHINLTSIVSFGLIVLVSWEAFAATFQFSLYNGGPSSMLYGCILVGFGATAVALSLAELASIDPTVGAQYRWAAELAPGAPKFWGLIQGWMTMFAWIVGVAAGPSLISTIILGIAKFNHPEYDAKRWHTTLLMWAILLPPFICNLFFRKLLAPFEFVGGICHFMFFIISIITLAVTAQRSPTDYVFSELTTGISGWDNPGVAWGLGLLTVTYAVSGFDGVLHMSDEVKRVRTQIPRSIYLSAIVNSIMLFAFVITLLFSIGNVKKVTNTDTGLPLIIVYYLATGSKGYASFLAAMPAIVLFFTLFNVLASVSRLIWVFAKDNGLPFSRTFAKVNPTLRVPLNSLLLVIAITIVLSLTYIGSSTAFNAIISLQAMALAVSYMPPITFHAIRRLRHTAPPPGPFSLGRAGGLSANLLALAYLLFVVIWMPFPQFLPVDKVNMNYAGPLLGAVMLGALLDWALGGRKRFDVPVAPVVGGDRDL